jgi:ABC-type cobalamin/Fe3+-siderophores transport system ATPase subunit
VGDLSLRNAAVGLADRTLVDALDFDVIGGELCAVVGSNGVGKTTLLRSIAGEQPLRAGAVRIAGRNPHALRSPARARLVTLAGQVDPPDGMRVDEMVATARIARRPWWDWSDDPDDRAAVLSALERVKLGAFAERPVGSLSSGERQRAVIALAIAQETQVVLFDEPTSHLDVRVAMEVLALLHALARSGMAVVAVLHDLNQAAMIADRIALLGCGRMLAYAKPAEVLASPLLDEAYGTTFARLDAGGQIRVVADGFRS